MIPSVTQAKEASGACTEKAEPVDAKVGIAGRVVKDYVEGAAYYVVPVAIVEVIKFAGFAALGPVGTAAVLLAPPALKYVVPQVAEKVSEFAGNGVINYMNNSA